MSICKLFQCYWFELINNMCIMIDIVYSWGHSSAGRALHWQCRGQGFEPPWLHQSWSRCSRWASVKAWHQSYFTITPKFVRKRVLRYSNIMWYRLWLSTAAKRVMCSEFRLHTAKVFSDAYKRRCMKIWAIIFCCADKEPKQGRYGSAIYRSSRLNKSRRSDIQITFKSMQTNPIA